MLTGLTQLRLTEARTSDPAAFSRLGVDDPNAAGSSADLLQVVDAAGKSIATLIVGHRRVRSQANVPDEVYIRRPDQAQSWLAQGSVQVDSDPASWIDRTIMDIPHDRIASVVVGDKALVFSRVNGSFALTEPRDHPALESYKVDSVARGLEMLTLQQVRPASDMPGAETGHAVFTTTDGLAVTVTLLHADNSTWATFAAAAQDKAQPEADRLNARLHGWIYEIGAWKEKALLPTLDDLKADTPPPAAAK